MLIQIYIISLNEKKEKSKKNNDKLITQALK